ncbi:MAG: hypothetical protein JSV15_06020 [Candidatus Bathyarchaeota archaeon]|nr:MAG: hypothetical protein JSV15_06020 [Candidatus Bathyarchaeota archaeon]
MQLKVTDGPLFLGPVVVLISLLFMNEAEAREKTVIQQAIQTNVTAMVLSALGVVLCNTRVLLLWLSNDTGFSWANSFSTTVLSGVLNLSSRNLSNCVCWRKCQKKRGSSSILKCRDYFGTCLLFRLGDGS